MNKRNIRVAVASMFVGALLVGAIAGPAHARTDIKVGVIAINSMGAIQYAQDTGIFRKNSLNVSEFVTFPAPPPGLAALNSGAVQFMYSPTIPVLNATYNGGLKLKIVAAADGYLKADIKEALKDDAFAGRLDDTGVCIAKNGAVKTWKDLAGKTVAVPARGAQGEVTIAAAVKKAGGDPSTINWVTLGFPEVQSAVSRGTIAAGFVVEPFTTACATAEAALKGPGTQFFTEGGAIGVWVTTEKFAKSNPAAVKNFQRAIYAANKAGMSRSKINAVTRASMKITKQTFVVAKSANPTFYPSNVLTREVQSVADKMQSLGYLKKKVNVRSLILPR
jgi:ABC-type nitrate/sulfonate/bicarbonate transport system substrate-binding protein